MTTPSGEPPAADAVTRAARIRLLLCAGFVLTGVVNTILGPLLGWLTERWSLTDAEAGGLFTLQFAGGLAAGIGSGWPVARFGEGRTIAAGFVVMSAGTAALAVGDAAVGRLGMLLTGVGLGLVIPPTNLLVARLDRGRAAAALGALNLAWGLGAALWPITLASSAPIAGVPAVLLGGALLLGVMAVPMTRIDAPLVDAVTLPVGGRSRAAATTLLFGLLISIYSGIEAALGGWMAEHARRLSVDGSTLGWALTATVFWAGLTAGRAVSAIWLSAQRETIAATGGLALAAVGVALLLSTEEPSGVLLAAALCGTGLAPVFPVTVAALSRELRPSVAGPIVALGALGGATFPLAVGAISDRSGSLGAGLATLLLALALLIALHVIRLSRRA